ncbi:MAG: hypothetical protein HQ517_05420 [SAR324 cluster bacterium]|nr:hypothetical protein [SAR324 cluster bacterium]
MNKDQTTLSIDKEIKAMAEERARIQHMSVSAVAGILLRDYALGKLEIGTRIPGRDENGFTSLKAKELDYALAEIEDEANLSPSFDNSKDSTNWLRKNS